MKARIETAEIIRRINACESESEIAKSVGLGRAAICDCLKRSKVELMPPDGYISAREFASQHNLHPDSVRRLTWNGRLPARKFKGRWYVPKDAFLACRKCGKPREKYQTYCTPCATTSEVASYKASYHRQVIKRKCRQETLRAVGEWLGKRGMVGQDSSYPHFIRVEISEIDALKHGELPGENFPHAACGDV